MNNIAPTELISAEIQVDRYYQYGDLDGLLNNQPDKELWRNNPEYKKGYLDGTSRRIDNEFNGVVAA